MWSLAITARRVKLTNNLKQKGMGGGANGGGGAGGVQGHGNECGDAGEVLKQLQRGKKRRVSRPERL